MREFRETDEPECKTCGACCVGSSADGDFVPVTRLDKKRLPTKYAKKLQAVVYYDDIGEPRPAKDGEEGNALGLKRFGQHESCVALKGTLGKDISCDIYDQRPEFCRTFERGSHECRKRRAELFIIIPAFTVE